MEVEVSRGVERSKYYYQARVLDRGLTVKVYDDNATIQSYTGLDARYEVLRVIMTTSFFIFQPPFMIIPV